MNLDDAKRCGWNVSRVIGRRKVIRITCPTCGFEAVVLRDDTSKLESGKMLWEGPRWKDGEMMTLLHPTTHGLIDSLSKYAVTSSLADLMRRLDYARKYGPPEDIVGVLRALGVVVRPFCGEAADFLDTVGVARGAL